MKAKDLDKKFDDGADIKKFLDLARAKDPAGSKSGSMLISQFG